MLLALIIIPYALAWRRPRLLNRTQILLLKGSLDSKEDTTFNLNHSIKRGTKMLEIRVRPPRKNHS